MSATELLRSSDFVLELRNLCLWHRVTAAVGGLQLRYVARDALLNPLQTPFHLGFGEVLIAGIDGLEFGSVNGDARLAQQIKLASQCHEGTANLTNGLAIVLTEIRDGLEVWCQIASCSPERFINLMGNIAPGPADVVEILLGQPGQFAPHRVSVVPHMEDFAHLAKRPSEQAESMMIYHQKS
jgi:hypothetical protein